MGCRRCAEGIPRGDRSWRELTEYGSLYRRVYRRVRFGYVAERSVRYVVRMIFHRSKLVKVVEFTEEVRVIERLKDLECEL